METEYLNLIRLFNEESVDYVVLGGHAVIIHGYPRTTGDIDIFVRPSADNAGRLLRALARFGYDNGEFSAEDFTTIPTYLSFNRHDEWFDLMNFTLGVTFEECFANRTTIHAEGVIVNVIGLPELLKNKKALGRPRDLDDLEHLLNPE